MSACIFCEIVEQKVPVKSLHETANWIAINDASPIAPIHVLIISKIHLESILNFTQNNHTLGMEFTNMISELTSILSLSTGFRIVHNVGQVGGQTVPHCHFHLIAGRQMDWPPG